MGYENHMKKKYDDIFVILTYKNTDDITELLESLRNKVLNYHVIIVNSFYNEEIRNKFEIIAQRYGCDYLPVENKGYGYGNNIGIKYAVEQYSFRRIVISNPDIVINEYDQSRLNKYPECVCGVYIENNKGKIQNPLRVSSKWFLCNSAYYLYVKKNKILFYISVIISKLQRQIVLRKNSEYSKVFAVHGSFFFITSSALSLIGNVFDERIFMFQEEIDLAYGLKKRGISVLYSNAVKVFHKEDGDVNISNINNSKIMYESCSYVYDKWKGQRN